MDNFEREAHNRTGRFREYRLAFRVVAAALLSGLALPLLFVVQSNGLAQALGVVSIALLLSGAAFSLGGIIGFLFGIPRSLQDIETAPASELDTERTSDELPSRARYVGNTNLEQISDWLTKILVGVGLTQLVNVPTALAGLGSALGPTLGGFPSSGMFAVLTSVYYSVGGFFLTYLWARLHLASLLTESDVEATRAAQHDRELRAIEVSRELTSVHTAGEVALRALRDVADPSLPRILWVDDRPTNNAREIREFESRGIAVDRATSTEKALELLEANSEGYGVVISDMARGRDRRAGYTLLEELRRRNHLLPYIIYAGSGKPENDVDAKRLGALGSTNSPVRLFELVTTALDQARATHPRG